MVLLGIVMMPFYCGSKVRSVPEYLQTLFSFLQAPVFVTFILGMFWPRMTAWAGFWGLLCGPLAAAGVWVYGATSDIFRSSFQQAMWMGIVAARADLIVSLAVSGAAGGGGDHPGDVHPFPGRRLSP